MQLLLDTHVMIWALEDNPKLTEQIRDYIVDSNNQIFVSTASIWEIAIKKSVKEDFQYEPKKIISLCAQAGFRFLAIGLDEIIAYNSLAIKENEQVNNDPVDKILISQAKTNNMRLISHDRMIAKYNEPCIIHF